MIPIRKLVNTAMQAYEQKWGYIWGKSGQTWTQANQNAATRAQTVQYGQQWVGKRVADCSGLFVYAYRENGGSIYHGSNTIWNKHLVPESRGALAGQIRIRYGSPVFQVVDGKRTHIGWYIGGGMVEEERGTKTGCILSPLATWDEYGELADADYSGEVYERFDIIPPDAVKKGSRSEVVRWVQNCLIEAGYDVGDSGADGIYGTETVSAVRAFQHDHNLTPDGIAGAKTYAALKALIVDDETGEEKPEAPEEPADAWAGLTDAEKLDDLNKRVTALEGRESRGQLGTLDY